MKSTLSSLLAGLIFGLGLIISEMVNPRRVQGFLDVTGDWDPTLAFVMAGALLVTSIGYKILFATGQAFFSAGFSLPTNRVIDAKLIIGALLFGAGWGLSGLCPGPAIVGASTLSSDILVFIAAMAAGMKGFELIGNKTDK